MVHRVDGPIGVYRGFDDGTDARIARAQPRARGRDGLPVAVQPREAPRARLRARATRSSSRTRSTRRSSIRRPRASRSTGGRCGSSRRAGRTTRARARRRSPGSTAISTATRYELTFVGRSPSAFERIRDASARSTPHARRRAPPRARRLPRAEPRRSVLERAPRGARVRAARGVSRRAAGTRSSSARAGSRSARTRSFPRCSTGSWRSSRSAARRSRCPRSRDVADRYLEVLGLAGRDLESPRPWRTTCDGARPACVPRRPAARPGRGRPARTTCSTSRTRGRKASWLGAQALKNPLDLWVYQEIIVETRPERHRRDRHVPRRERALPGVDLRPRSARARSSRSTSSRCATTIRSTRGSRTSAAARRPIPDVVAEVRARADGRRDARHPRLRPLAGARRGRARGVRAARARRLLPDRRGLEHRADPEGPHARPAARRSRRSSRGPTSSRSTASARSSSSRSTRAATCAGFASSG